MATLAKLRTLVNIIVQDPDIEADITDTLNQGVLEIAGGMQSTLGSLITPPLPNLFTISTVDTVTTGAYVSMPATFHRDLQFVAKESGAEVDIANSFISFSESNPLLDRSGSIYEVAEQGGNLYYQGIPTTAETLTLHFYRLPVDMSLDSSEPDGIPSHLQIPLLVNYAAWKFFELIEDGMEGPGPNTERYMGLFNRALRTLELGITYDTRGMNLI